MLYDTNTGLSISIR